MTGKLKHHISDINKFKKKKKKKNLLKNFLLNIHDI